MRLSARRYVRDLAFACGLLVLLILFYWPVTLGGKTMVPADILLTRQPWLAQGPVVPHNGLVADLLVENYVWKQFIVESLRARQVPLWNPYVLSGVPFLAAGQHSALYPFSLIFYILPLARAYGLFTVSQLLVAGLSLYFYARTIKLSRFAAAAGGLVFALSGFFLVSTVFPMIIAVAAWLPFTLAVTERMLQAIRIEAEAEGRGSWRKELAAPLPWLILGSLSLGLQFLAGHVEIFYYNLLVLGAYALWQAVAELRRRRRDLALFAACFAVMVGLGAGLGAVQVLPLYEHVSTNFRQDSATYEQIVGWAFPLRHLAAFAIPDVFGSPAHHSYVDLWSGQVVTALKDAQGGAIDTIFWGVKNYVEGGVYISLLGMALALIGALKRPRRHAWFFIALGLLSLSFAFGLPTYRLLYALPGISQLHSPFRWVFPYSVCIAVLAAMGVEVVTRERSRLAGALGLVALAGSALTLAGLALSRAFPGRVLPLADRAVARLALAANAFADGRAFLSYEARNLLLFAACLGAAGAVLLASSVKRRTSGTEGLESHASRITHYASRFAFDVPRLALLALLALDPWLWFHDFMPAADPAPLSEVPEVVQFLRQQPGPFRIVVYDTQSHKPLPPNTNMLFGLSSVSGYDSIIPKWYAEVMSAIQPQELEYNQISRLTRPEALDSPILDLLNVRYVLSEEAISRPGYTLVYDGALRVYRHDDALPRAFVTFQVESFADRAALLGALKTADPRRAVLLEGPVAGWQNPDVSPAAPEVQFVEDTPNEVKLRVDMPAPGFLVLADNWAPGWVAYTTADGQTEEQALTVWRADGTVRAVQLPAGAQTVRFKYSPTSFKVGLFVSFMAGVALLLLGALWVWLRLYSPRGEEHAVRRVARNTAGPLAFQLLNKAIDMAFMMLALRLLGHDNAGKYYFAVVVAGWFEILTNFGLNTFVTREVAKNREDANLYLWNSTTLRMGLALVALPLLALFLVAYRPPLPGDTILAIGLLFVGLIPSSISAGLSAVFSAFEVMGVPAAVSTVTTLFKVGLGTAALLLGWGFVGLAGVSIVVNTVTMAILILLLVAMFFRPHRAPQPALRRSMVVESYPLMINHLLATLFFKVDVILLQHMQGDAIVGWYSTSYKFVDTVGIIPPVFTMAIFPLISRLAASARDSLSQAYILSIKLLVSLALLLALSISALAYPLILLFAGADYLPHSAIALEIIIWYMPLGFINSVTQYVLIALNEQRFLTRAFLIGLAFNLGANLLLIPRFGYRAAAVVSIFSELALLIPFYVGVRRHLAPIPWVRILWRPVAALGTAVGCLWLLRGQNRLAAVALAVVVYVALVFALRTFNAAELALLRRVVPVDRMLARLGVRLPAHAEE